MVCWKKTKKRSRGKFWAKILPLKYCEHNYLPLDSCFTHIEEMFGDSDILKSLKHLEETLKVLNSCVHKEQTHNFKDVLFH